MFKTRLIQIISTAFIAAFGATAVHAAPLSTGDFTGWLPRAYTELNASTSITFNDAGGNPGAHVQITNYSQRYVSSLIIAGVLYPHLVKTDTGNWASTLTIDFNTNVNAGGDHHALGLLAEQDNRLYWLWLKNTGVSSVWSTFDSGAFNVTGAAFNQLTGGIKTLDLSKPFLAGFTTGNSRSGSRGSAYDNLSLGGVEKVESIPLPAPILLLAGAFGGLGLLRQLSRRTA